MIVFLERGVLKGERGQLNGCWMRTSLVAVKVYLDCGKFLSNAKRGGLEEVE